MTRSSLAGDAYSGAPWTEAPARERLRGGQTSSQAAPVLAKPFIPFTQTAVRALVLCRLPRLATPSTRQMRPGRHSHPPPVQSPAGTTTIGRGRLFQEGRGVATFNFNQETCPCKPPLPPPVRSTSKASAGALRGERQRLRVRRRRARRGKAVADGYDDATSASGPANIGETSGITLAQPSRSSKPGRHLRPNRYAYEYPYARKQRTLPRRAITPGSGIGLSASRRGRRAGDPLAGSQHPPRGTRRAAPPARRHPLEPRRARPTAPRPPGDERRPDADRGARSSSREAPRLVPPLPPWRRAVERRSSAGRCLRRSSRMRGYRRQAGWGAAEGVGERGARAAVSNPWAAGTSRVVQEAWIGRLARNPAPAHLRAADTSLPPLCTGTRADKEPRPRAFSTQKRSRG